MIIWSAQRNRWPLPGQCGLACPGGHNLLRPRAAWLASPMPRHAVPPCGGPHRRGRAPCTARYRRGEIILHLPENWHRPQDRIHLFDAAWGPPPRRPYQPVPGHGTHGRGGHRGIPPAKIPDQDPWASHKRVSGSKTI